MTAVEPRKRRPTGEPRRLILAAARELFSSRGYSDTATRELADRAGVSETLIFRYFGSKAVLFREALVVPFVEFVDDWAERNRSGVLDHLSDADFTKGYITDVYQLFRANRGLLAVVWAADTNEEHVLAVTAGMAAFGHSFYGGPRPSDDDIIDDVVQLILHGYLYTSPSKVTTGTTKTTPRVRSKQPEPVREELGARPPS